MPRRSTVDDSPPESGVILDALGDDATRDILETLTEPMTASELSDRCEIPLSTMYRKLERLTDASLLVERTQIKRNGQHTTRYARNFASVSVELDAESNLSVAIDRPEETATADQRLEELWAQIKEET